MRPDATLFLFIPCLFHAFSMPFPYDALRLVFLFIAISSSVMRCYACALLCVVVPVFSSCSMQGQSDPMSCPFTSACSSNLLHLYGGIFMPGGVDAGLLALLCQV